MFFESIWLPFHLPSSVLSLCQQRHFSQTGFPSQQGALSECRTPSGHIHVSCTVWASCVDRAAPEYREPQQPAGAGRLDEAPVLKAPALGWSVGSPDPFLLAVCLAVASDLRGSLQFGPSGGKGKFELYYSPWGSRQSVSLAGPVLGEQKTSSG